MWESHLLEEYLPQTKYQVLRFNGSISRLNILRWLRLAHRVYTRVTHDHIDRLKRHCERPTLGRMRKPYKYIVLCLARIEYF